MLRIIICRNSKYEVSRMTEKIHKSFVGWDQYVNNNVLITPVTRVSEDYPDVENNGLYYAEVLIGPPLDNNQLKPVIALISPEDLLSDDLFHTSAERDWLNPDNYIVGIWH